MADPAIYDKLARVLQDVHERFPEDGFAKHQRLRGLLADHLPEAEREIRIVLDAIDEGVVGVLTDTPANELGMQVDRLVLRLDTSRGIREDIARQIIQAFTYSLGLGGLPSTVSSTPMPQTPAGSPSAGEDWVGVSEVVTPPSQPTPDHPATQANSVSSGVEQPGAPASAKVETDSWVDKVPGGKFGALAIGVIVALVLVASNNEPSAPGSSQNPPQQKPPVQQPPGQQAPQRQAPQSGGGSPVVDPGATDGLPRVGPGAEQPPQQATPARRPQPNPQVQPNRPTNNPPVGAAGSVVWYDPYGVVWQLQITGNEFQGMGLQNNTPVMSMYGVMDPPNNQLYYQLFDGGNQQVGEGAGTMTDPTHIQFETYDAVGNLIGQGVFHINHPPNG